MLKFSTNQSGHVTILSLSDRSNFSVASIEAEKTFIGSGPGGNLPLDFLISKFRNLPLGVGSPRGKTLS